MATLSTAISWHFCIWCACSAFLLDERHPLSSVWAPLHCSNIRWNDYFPINLLLQSGSTEPVFCFRFAFLLCCCTCLSAEIYICFVQCFTVWGPHSCRVNTHDAQLLFVFVDAAGRSCRWTCASMGAASFVVLFEEVVSVPASLVTSGSFIAAQQSHLPSRAWLSHVHDQITK